MPSSPLVPTAVFVSGGGTNLQAVVDAVRDGLLPLDLRLVLSNEPNAYALQRARNAGIPVAVEQWRRPDESRAGYASRLATAVRASGARLVLLLGFMHVLSREFLDAGFEGVLNLHPAYLPDDPAADTVKLPDGSTMPVFRGPHALRDAIAAKVRTTGATLIAITPEIDRGPVLARQTFSLHEGEDEITALGRLREVEHEVVRQGVLSWIRQTRS